MYLVAEVFSDCRFFYQGTVSAINFRKRRTKFKITIALPKKFGSKGFITVVKVTKYIVSRHLLKSVWAGNLCLGL